METRILVPLDGSRLAEQALSCALTLGQGLPAELILFRAVSIPSDVQDALDKADLDPDPLFEKLESEAGEYLEAMIRLVSKPGLSLRQVVRRGLAADAILDYAEQMDVQFIVMASHGYTGIKRWRHGSVAERVLQKAGAPLLLVRARETGSTGLPEACPCRRILVPLDGSPLAEQVLPAVTRIAMALGCEVTLFQVPTLYASSSLIGEWYMPRQDTFAIADEDARVYLERLAGELNQQGIPSATATGAGAVADCIIDHADANDLDLIAMCTHGRTGLARWALGSVADRVLRAGDKPILLVRAKKG